jgi:polyferredoxin
MERPTCTVPFAHLAALVAAAAAFAVGAVASAEDRFPPPDFQGGHTVPEETYPVLSSAAWDSIDLGLLALALVVAAWLAFKKRSRGGLLLLTLFGLGYFGFYREGCVCPIGAIQNVTAAAFDPGVGLPWVIAAFFALPIAFSLFFGRVFCSGVCPLGALQDIVSWKSLAIPRWLESALGVLAFAYLALAVVAAAVGGAFLICQYDPFVAIFRLNGPSHMLAIGGGILLLGLMVGRPYCRFLCPYGAILRVTSRLSWKRVAVAPGECIRCHLCKDACPYNAIMGPTAPLARPRSALRRQFLGSLFVGLLIAALLAYFGYAAGSRFAMLHRDVVLASELLRGAETDATRSFLAADGDRRALYDHARQVQQWSALGLAIGGAAVGFVILHRLLHAVKSRRKDDYTADPSACLACGRCFAKCPVELQRRGVALDPALLPVIALAPVAPAAPTEPS